MKKYLLIAAAAASAACSNSAPVVQNTPASNSQPPRNERPATVTAHTTENQPPSPMNSGGAPGKWSAGGEPIDTARFDGTIKAAEEIVKSKPGDEKAKKDLAQAYYDRANALKDARQYASAIGDYRRALKYDPNHEDSKNWISQIESIYKMLKKDSPKEGEEPPPLPFKKA